MRWEFSEEQEMFREALEDWLGGAAGTDTVRRWLDTADPAPFESGLVQGGWMAVGSPEDLGGQGGGLVEQALAAEQLARHAAPSAAWLASVLALPALHALPDITGEVLTDGVFAALAVSAAEPPDARTPVLSQPDGTLIGAVPNVLGADRARYLVVPARHGAEVRLFLVDVEDGATVRTRQLIDRSRSVADVQLDGVAAVPLGVDTEAVLADAALRAAVLVAADSLGAAERMLDLAVEYSKQRHQFGVPIGSFQAVKHAAAQMLVAVEASRSVVFYAAASLQGGHAQAALHCASAKVQGTAAGVQVADLALTLHGAIGYTWEHDLQLFYKRAKLDGQLFGTPEVWNERLARVLFLLPAAEPLLQ